MHRGSGPSGPTTTAPRRALTTSTSTSSGNMRTMNVDYCPMEVSDLSASESFSSVSTSTHKRISRRDRIKESAADSVPSAAKRISRRDRTQQKGDDSVSAASSNVRISRKDRRKGRRRSPKTTSTIQTVQEEWRPSDCAPPALMRRSTLDTPINLRHHHHQSTTTIVRSNSNISSNHGPPLQRRATSDSITTKSITINITVERRRRPRRKSQQGLDRNSSHASISCCNDNSTISTTPSLQRRSTIDTPLSLRRPIVSIPEPMLLRRSSTDFSNNPRQRQAPAKPQRRASILTGGTAATGRQQTQRPDLDSETSVTDHDDEYWQPNTSSVLVREVQDKDDTPPPSFRRMRTADSLPIVPQRRYSVSSSNVSSVQRSLSFSENDCLHPSTSRWGTAR
ncbi:expressed unknown protein [Seminavis robusta]|uniref:Uncharacterized protein n=1 Tax=Seminavis robusta TaxID=568900 RepID=A0A9N8DHD1_9STRA|nr:expressed unknown protein [Seminavis robusta]|eukprot:Sro86_g045600.1 n/a (395) ;mRNA; f:22406-23590